jgi:hypothetical protein
VGLFGRVGMTGSGALELEGLAFGSAMGLASNGGVLWWPVGLPWLSFGGDALSGGVGCFARHDSLAFACLLAGNAYE